MKKAWTFPVVATMKTTFTYKEDFSRSKKVKNSPFVIIRMGNLLNANAVCGLLELLEQF